MSRSTLIEMARHNLAHAQANTIEQEPDVFRVPASHYFEPGRWKQEVDRVFKRMPLMLAMGCELKNPGDFKTMEPCGIPVVLVRGNDGVVRAFINSCAHRGAVVATEPAGNTHRLTCPYHAWTYDLEGRLTGVFAHRDFGEFDHACHGLTSLRTTERAGLVWVILDPASTLDFDRFLCGYDDLLAHFGFATWHLFDRRTIRGPNWKIAYDGYMDLYHLPILHKDTFGSQFPYRALYYPYGPHQRVSSPDPSLAALPAGQEEQWPIETLLRGVWTIFPHVSIASFDGGGRGVMISQLFPGEEPGTSYTVQNYLMENHPSEEQTQAAHQQFKLLEYVVQVEDYGTGLRQQQALQAGARTHVLFGRNEGGGHRFHRWVEQLLATDDQDLNALFGEPAAAQAAD